MKKTIGALMVAVSAVAMAANAEAMEYNPYAGVEYGYSFLNGTAANNFNSGKVFVGSQYNENFGVEAFYQRSTTDKKAGNKASYQAYGIDALGYLPMGCEQKVALVGTAGLAYYDFAYKEMGHGTNNEGTWGYRLGAGAEYNVNENVAVRALARYTKLDQRVADSNDMMEYSIGARYNF